MHGLGSPDDLAWTVGTLLASDIKRGRIGFVAHRRVRTLVDHIRRPDGIVPGPSHCVIGTTVC